jgi:hypothetical protein
VWHGTATTLQSYWTDTNSNLILLPNSPQAGSDMLNNMQFTASNMVGESMKQVDQTQNRKTWLLLLPIVPNAEESFSGPRIKLIYKKKN